MNLSMNEILEQRVFIGVHGSNLYIVDSVSGDYVTFHDYTSGGQRVYPHRLFLNIYKPYKQKIK